MEDRKEITKEDIEMFIEAFHKTRISIEKMFTDIGEAFSVLGKQFEEIKERVEKERS